jgi:predicted transcriptional regulator
MPSVTVEIPAEVVRALDRQARALLLSRRTYLRAVIAAVAAQAERESSSQPPPDTYLEPEESSCEDGRER